METIRTDVADSVRVAFADMRDEPNPHVWTGERRHVWCSDPVELPPLEMPL